MNINNFHNSEDLNIFNKAKNFIEQNKRFAVSTVISTWGSSPRPIGSQMLVSEDNEIVGSVSGGCIEGSVIQTSLDIINGGDDRIRTGVHGFAVRCVTTPPRRPFIRK